MALYQRTVLVVEDELLIRLALADTLEDAGYQVLEAANVLEAVAVLGSERAIDAVITDVDMPGGLNGFDLMKLINTCYKNTAVIVTSGGHTPDKADLPDGYEFIAKPCRPAHMLERLEAQLSRRDLASSCTGDRLRAC